MAAATRVEHWQCASTVFQERLIYHIREDEVPVKRGATVQLISPSIDDDSQLEGRPGSAPPPRDRDGREKGVQGAERDKDRDSVHLSDSDSQVPARSPLQRVSGECRSTRTASLARQLTEKLSLCSSPRFAKGQQLELKLVLHLSLSTASCHYSIIANRSDAAAWLRPSKRLHLVSVPSRLNFSHKESRYLG